MMLELNDIVDTAGDSGELLCSPERSGLAVVLVAFCEEKLSLEVSGRPGLPTAAMVSALSAKGVGFGGRTAGCCLFLS